MNDQTKERIKFETELLKLAALLLVASGGSGLGLLLSDLTATRLVLGLAGVGGAMVIAGGIIRFYRRINRLIDLATGVL